MCSIQFRDQLEYYPVILVISVGELFSVGFEISV
jgi:hypothetical protein